MKDNRRLYDDDFKMQALLQIQSGISVNKLSKSLGVTQVTLHKWKNEYIRNYQAEANLIQAGPGSGPIHAAVQTNEYLLKRVHDLEAERDALKNALYLLLRNTPV